MLVPEEAIEINGYYTWMDKDGIARTCVKPYIDITLKEALENTAVVSSLYRGKKFPCLLIHVKLNQ